MGSVGQAETPSFDAASLFNVRGLVAVITGGGSGIGLMMTKALALNGASKVYIIGRRKQVLEDAVKQSPHGNIIPMVGDVTSKDDIEAIVKKIESDVGYVNVLVVNSGILGPVTPGVTKLEDIGEVRKTLWNVDFNDYSNTFNVNTTAAFFSAVGFLGLLDAGNKKANLTQSSQIIITSSIAGYNRMVPGGIAYGGSKTAATHLTKQLATILGPHGIRANALAPGLFESDLARPIIGNGKFNVDELPAGRIGDPEEMAGTILYLTSRAGGYCDGVILLIDGGRVSRMPSTY